VDSVPESTTCAAGLLPASPLCSERAEDIYRIVALQLGVPLIEVRQLTALDHMRCGAYKQPASPLQQQQAVEVITQRQDGWQLHSRCVLQLECRASRRGSTNGCFTPRGGRLADAFTAQQVSPLTRVGEAAARQLKVLRQHVLIGTAAVA
jgi:hypothetical protein